MQKISNLGKIMFGALSIVCIPLTIALLYLAAAKPLSTPVAAQSQTFLETFDGYDPGTPQFFKDNPLAIRWDITTHSRDGAGGGLIGSHDYSLLEFPAMVHHGDDCSPPMDMHNNQTYEGTSFICKQHLMTSIFAPGAGVVVVTPDQMVDFSQGTATIQFRASTLRTTGRDYWQVNITPWDTHQQLVQGAINADLNGQPPKSIVINQRLFDAAFPADGSIEGYQVTDTFARLPLNLIYVPRPQMPYGIGQQSYNEFLTPSAVNRELFEIKISADHISVCMPEFPDEECFIDTALPETLNWNKGLVQFSHISYNPKKGCSDSNPSCAPNTLHWDDFKITPSIPYGIVKATDRSYMSESTCPTCDATVTINFDQPAPPESKLRFAALAADDSNKTDQLSSLKVSYDNGATWQSAVSQRQDLGSDGVLDDWTFWSYFTGSSANGGYVPEGITSVKIKGLPSGRTKINSANGEIWVRDVSLFALNGSSTPPAPTPVPSGTPMPTSTPTASTTPPAGTPQPTSTPVPPSTPASTPTPLYADLNKNGVVDAPDYTIFIQKYNDPLPNIADIDHDGDVDIYDLNFIVTHLGQT